MAKLLYVLLLLGVFSVYSCAPKLKTDTPIKTVRLDTFSADLSKDYWSDISDTLAPQMAELTKTIGTALPFQTEYHYGFQGLNKDVAAFYLLLSNQKKSVVREDVAAFVTLLKDRLSKTWKIENSEVINEDSNVWSLRILIGDYILFRTIYWKESSQEPLMIDVLTPLNADKKKTGDAYKALFRSIQ